MNNATATSEPTRVGGAANESKATGLRILVGLAVLLAVAGAAIAGLLLARTAGGRDTGAAGNAIGQPVRTAFGTFTVTNVKTTFVPDTQGPPTAAQHDGTKGSYQLQVWVRLTNERADDGLGYAPAQLRMVTVPGPRKGQAADGSTFKSALLPRGGGIDGQVWFNLRKEVQSTGGTRQWLTFTYPGGDVIRIPLDVAPAAPAPHSGGNTDPHSQHDE